MVWFYDMLYRAKSLPSFSICVFHQMRCLVPSSIRSIFIQNWFRIAWQKFNKITSTDPILVFLHRNFRCFMTRPVPMSLCLPKRVYASSFKSIFSWFVYSWQDALPYSPFVHLEFLMLMANVALLFFRLAFDFCIIFWDFPLGKKHQVLQVRFMIHTFFIKIPKFLPSLDIPKFFFGFEPCIILELFLNIEGVTVSETQRIIFKSLLVSYFIIKPNQIGTK